MAEIILDMKDDRHNNDNDRASDIPSNMKIVMKVRSHFIIAD